MFGIFRDARRREEEEQTRRREARLAELTALRARVAKLEGALRLVEWAAGQWPIPARRICPACGWSKLANGGHGPDCIVGHALSGPKDGGG